MEEKKELQTGVVDVSSPEEVFNALRGELARITIFRDGKVLDRVLPEEVDDDLVFWVKEKYGGGKYLITLFGKDGKIKKRLSFAVDGAPKFPEEEKGEGKDAMVELLSKLIEKVEEKGNSSSDMAAVFQMMMKMQQENTRMIVELLKNEKPKEKGFLDSLIDKVLSNPQVLITAGGGLWKLIQKAVANRNELLELIKVAKDDPELKELAVQAVGAKYGGGGGIIDRIFSNPELLSKTLEIIDKALTIREVGQNPIPAVKRELRKMARIGQNGQIEQSTAIVDNSVDRNADNGREEGSEEVVSMQEVVAIGTKILELAEKGTNAEQIWESLSDREIDVLVALADRYGVKDSEGLITLLNGLPVPSFAVAGYVEAVKRHKAVVDELLSFLTAGEVEGKVGVHAVNGEVRRQTEGDLQGDSKADVR